MYGVKMPKCFICGLVVSGINDIHRHFKLIHKLDKFTAEYKCGETTPKCFQTCSSWGDIRRHYKSFHNFLVNSNADGSANVTPGQNSSQRHRGVLHQESVPNFIDNDDTGKNNYILEHVRIPKNISLKEQVQQYAVQFVSKLYAKPGQPRSLVQEYINDTSEFLSSTLSTIDKIVQYNLETNNVNSDVIAKVSNSISILKEPFADLTSEYFRLKYLKRQGYYIEPEVYPIFSDMMIKKVDKRMKLELDSVNGVFIPLRKVLKAFLELPNVFTILIDALQTSRPSGIISDFIHGFHWQNKKMLFEDKLVIPLYVFYDDYEVDKDIGPHSAKLNAIYIKVACLPPEFQGALENIFLALLFDAQDRNDLTNERVFRKFIQEINYLQSTGIEIVINDQTYRVYFTIGLVVADNLAMHTLLGFVESFSSNYPCRFCRIHKRIIHFQCEEDPGLFRDKAQHELDCFEANVKNSGVNCDVF